MAFVIELNTEIHFLPVDESYTRALFKDTKHLRLRRWPDLLFPTL